MGKEVDSIALFRLNPTRGVMVKRSLLPVAGPCPGRGYCFVLLSTTPPASPVLSHVLGQGPVWLAQLY